jgi:hypothetical protein
MKKYLTIMLWPVWFASFCFHAKQSHSQSLVLYDEFDGSQLSSYWQTQADWGPNYQANDAQVYLPDNVEVSNGTVKLKLLYQPGTYNTTIPKKDFDYTSGTLFSVGNFHYGIFEMKCKIPEDTWPAFWLYGGCGEEVDIFEFLGCTENNPKITIHEAPPDNCDNNLSCGKTLEELNYPVYYDFSNGFYTWKLDWKPDELSIYVNNVQIYHCNADGFGACLYHTTNASGGSCTAGTNTFYPTGLMDLIVNLATNPNDCTPPTPSLFIIDYIKVWQYPEEEVLTCTPFRPSDVVINDNHIHGSTLHIENSITNDPSVTVEDDANVWWTAGDYLEFTSGFTVEEGATFTAEIKPCSGFVRQKNDSSNIGEESTKYFPDSLKSKSPVIFPNPSNGRFTLNINESSKAETKEGGPFSISIMNIYGEYIYHSANNNDSVIDISNQSKGIYFLKIENRNKIITEKVVVQ